MSLRQRIILAIALAALVIGGATWLLGQLLVRDRFDRAEHEAALERFELLGNAFAQQGESLSGKCADWAQWDDAYAFMADQRIDHPFATGNLTPSPFRSLYLEAIAYISADRATCTGWAFDLGEDGWFAAPPDWAGLTRIDSIFLDRPVHGLVAWNDTIWHIAAQPVTDSNATAAPRGWLIFGLRIEAAEIDRIGQRVGLKAYAVSLPQHPRPMVLHSADGEQNQVAGPLPGVDGRPILAVAFNEERKLHRYGVEAHQALFWVVLATGLVCTLVAMALVELTVVRRVVRMGRELRTIAGQADPHGRVSETGAPEFIALAASINHTLAALGKTQAALRESADLRRAMIAALPDPLLLVSGKGSFRHAASEAGDGSQTWVDGHLSRLVPEADLPRAAQLVAGALDRSEWGVIEFTDPRKHRHFELRVHPFNDELAIALLRDVSARVEAERRMQRATAAAEAANQAKSEFLSGISHELRTPLNGIIGMATLLAAADLGGEARERIAVVRACAEDLLSLIDELLDLGRIESGRVDLDERAFAPDDICFRAVEPLAPRAQAKGVELGLAVQPTVPPRLIGDPNRVRQIVANLVSNAVKFTDQGEVEVQVSATPDDAGWWRLTIAVRDTGPGMTPEVAKRLFRPFERGDATLARRHAGTGLGLAISRRLAQLMQGDITVDSAPGQGSTFLASLRLREAASESAPGEGQAQALGLVAVVAGTPCLRSACIAALAPIARGIAVVDRPEPGIDVAVVDAAVCGVPDGINAVLLVSSSWVGSPPPGCTVLRKPVHPRRLREAALAAARGQSIGSGSYVIGGDKAEKPSAAIAQQLRAGVRVLVVDDQPVNRAIAVGYLRVLGIAADTASGGAEAVAKVLAGGFDLVLMDCRMPEIDGYEATRRIRAAETASAHLPIVALTASASADDRGLCKAAGMDDHLPKPLRLPDLEATLHRWLAATPGSATTATAAARPAAALADPITATVHRLREDAGPEAVVAAIGALLNDAPGMIAACAAAIERRDAAALVDPAHSLKGTCATFGLDSLAQHAAALVEIGRSGDIAGAAEAFAALTAAWKSAEPRLHGAVK
jgi:signal transduction histidine kinase/sensor domain CHASE-containing protein/DNA-binding NarL/FixJ family response regulator/HPt (histidine-containing phosphotransfer) domain-containing protein